MSNVVIATVCSEAGNRLEFDRLLLQILHEWSVAPHERSEDSAA